MITEHLWRSVAQPCGFVPSRPMGTDVSLAAPGWWHFPSPLIEIPAATWPHATADMGSVSVPLASNTPGTRPSFKQQHPSSDQGMPNPGQEEEAPCDLPKVCPCKKWKPLARALREAQWDGKGGQADLLPDPQRHVWTGRVLWPHLSFLGDDLEDKPPGCWDMWGAGDLDQPVEA